MPRRVLRIDNADGDGAAGYGFNGTILWPTRWTTAFDDAGNFAVNPAAGANPGDFNHPDTLYQAQTQGNLCGIYNSVFFNNTNYTEAENIGTDSPGEPFAAGVSWGPSGVSIFDPGFNNLKEPASSPIVSVTREALTVKGGKATQRVTLLDPRAATTRSTLVAPPPTTASSPSCPYAGAFSKDSVWIRGWTAADQFGMVAGPARAARFDLPRCS